MVLTNGIYQLIRKEGPLDVIRGGG